MNGDDFCNTLCSNAQGVVCLSEGIEYCEVWINLAETLVVDNQQRIYVLRHLFYTIQCLVDLLRTFEAERNGYDTNGKDSEFLAHSCDDRRSTGSGTTTHSGSDESHLGAVVQHVLDLLQGFLGSLASLGRLVAGSQTFLAQLQMYRYWRIVECLIISVTQYEAYVVDAFTVHVVDSVATATTYTNHLDDAVFLFWLSKVQNMWSICVI